MGAQSTLKTLQLHWHCFARALLAMQMTALFLLSGCCFLILFQGLMKIVQFSRPPTLLSIYVQNSSTPLTLDIQFQTNHSPSPNDNQSIKRKHNPRMTIICYQVLPSDQLSFDFFSINWSLICFFVVLYSCVCSCPKILGNVFHL